MMINGISGLRGFFEFNEPYSMQTGYKKRATPTGATLSERD
jgi:hypothetical protein